MKSKHISKIWAAFTLGLGIFALGTLILNAEKVQEFLEANATPGCEVEVLTDYRSRIGQVGQPFSYTVQTKGENVQLSVDRLPPGLTLNGKTVSGTPTQEGTMRANFTATNNCGTHTQGMAFVVKPEFRIPGCTLTNDRPVTTVGGTATISWRVEGVGTVGADPTSGTITPALSGNPDFTRNGSMSTGPLTADTTFKLTVSNAAGTGSPCTTTVQVQIPSENGWDVGLVESAPVFTRFDIPGGFDTLFGWFPFESIEWVPGGNFVVSGECVSGAGLQPGQFEFESGGMYILSETGNFIANRDVCYDTTNRAAGCGELFGCSTGDKVMPFGPNKFVRELQTKHHGFNRSPVVYEVSGNNVNMVDRLFFDKRFNGAPGEGTQVGDVIKYEHVAVANGKMIGVETRYAGVAQTSEHTVIYSLPELEKINESPVQYYPIIGIGDYFLAAEQAHGEFIDVYRMPTTAGTAPQKVQDLADKRLYDYALDPNNPNRIALHLVQSGQQRNNSTITVYEAGANGLEVVQTATIPPLESGIIGHNHKFAILGDYLFYGGDCKPGTGANQRYEECTLIVQKNGQRLNVEPLPRGSDGIAQKVRSLAVSPAGKVLVAAYGSADNGNLYLYQIKDFSGGTPTNSPSQPQPDPSEPQEPNTPNNPDESNNPNDPQTPNPPNTPQTPNTPGNEPDPNNPQTPTSNPNNQGSNAPALCSNAGGNGCTYNVGSGELQLSAAGENGCTQDSFCVSCAEGYLWNPGTLDCTQTTACTDTVQGNGGCSFSVGSGETRQGEQGAYGCSGYQSYCVACEDGYTWDGSNCQSN